MMGTLENKATCNVCDQRNILGGEAVFWCTVCDEPLCQDCNEVHKFSRSSCNHEVITLAEYQKLPPFLASLKRRCDRHNEHYQLYCPVHKEPCCCECASTGHNTCHGFQFFESLVKNMSTKPFLDLECAINELSINVDKVFENRTLALKHLDEEVKKIRTEIGNTREKINETLDNMERELLKQLSEVHSKCKLGIEKFISDLEETKTELEQVQKNVEQMKLASKTQIFLGSRLLHSKLENLETTFLRHFKNEQKDVHLKFTPNTIVEDYILLGKFDIEEVPCDVPFKKNESLGSDLSLEILQNIESVQMRTVAQFKLYDGQVTRNLAGCTFLENGHILFPDWSDNNELLFFDEKGKRHRNIVLDKKAFDIVYLGQNCIALSFPDAKLLSVLDLKTRQEKLNKTFENRCWGITSFENHLYVREYSAGIHCMDMHGEIVQTIPVSGYITHITSYGGKLYFTEHTPDVVHCCEADGTQVWQIALDGQGQPKGITVGKFGFVFVVLEKECKLLLISPDGSCFREILNAENGLKEPHAINYDKKRDKLLLVKDKTGLAELYDVLY